MYRPILAIAFVAEVEGHGESFRWQLRTDCIRRRSAGGAVACSG